MAQENKYNKFINLIDDIKLNESRLRIYPETYPNSRMVMFKKEYQLDSRAEINFETDFFYNDGSKVCLGDRVSYQGNDKVFMVKFDEKREMISQNTYDGIVKDEMDLFTDRVFLYNSEEKHNHNLMFIGNQPLKKLGNVYNETLLYKEQNLEFKKAGTGNLVIQKHNNLEIRGYDYHYHDKIHIYHDELQEFIDLCKSNPSIQKFKDDPISKDIEIRHESKLNDFPHFSVNLNAFIELSMRNDIQTKEQLYKVALQQSKEQLYKAALQTQPHKQSYDSKIKELNQIDKEKAYKLKNEFYDLFYFPKNENADLIKEVQDTHNHLTKIMHDLIKQIDDFEKKKAVLLPDAKERKIKEIFEKIHKRQFEWKEKNLTFTFYNVKFETSFSSNTEQLYLKTRHKISSFSNDYEQHNKNKFRYNKQHNKNKFRYNSNEIAF